ncbi:MAG: thiol protease/hemagglutinin PrtT [Bacteroidales bacterium]|nr:thiol protease/hemagglutinin PrtT [Bacteroidales bacterium]
MKKLLLTTLIIAMAVLAVSARSITPPEAAKAANSVLLRNGLSGDYNVLNRFSTLTGMDYSTIAYIFPFEPEGFAVVSAEKELPPVLFYTLEGSFSDAGYGKDFAGFLLADLRTRLDQVPLLPADLLQARQAAWDRIIHDELTEQGFEQWPPSGSTPTGGWLMENWHQNSPYNDFCPKDPVTGNRSVAGCPATAMAMIVNYFENLNGTVFTDSDDYYHNYAGRQYWIDDDYLDIEFLSFPDMNSWLDTLLLRWANNQPVKNPEKAALTFACGVAARQVYTSSVSGTFGVDQAYDAYIRFGFSQCELLTDTDTSLYSKLSQNMKDGIPAHLAVVDPGWTMGHNVVLDGYNTDDYYHINFGWGGTYNGWYLVPDEIPYGLTVIEGVVLNIADVSTGTVQSAYEEKARLSVYPNPADDHLVVDCSWALNQDAAVYIYNNTGAIIESQTFGPAHQGSVMIRLNGKYRPGIYFCLVRSGSREQHAGFIVK